MVYINEWVPNPVGADAKGEWVELWNSGTANVPLDGWMLKTKSGGKFSLSGSVEGGGYILIPRAKSRLVFKNTDEAIFLYDSRGNLIDQSAFPGSAPAGESFARTGGGRFVFANIPTPGARNQVVVETGMIYKEYPGGTPLTNSLSGPQLSLLVIGTSVCLVALLLFVVKRNENLSKLFFGRD